MEAAAAAAAATLPTLGQSILCIISQPSWEWTLVIVTSTTRVSPTQARPVSPVLCRHHSMSHSLASVAAVLLEAQPIPKKLQPRWSREHQSAKATALHPQARQEPQILHQLRQVKEIPRAAAAGPLFQARRSPPRQVLRAQATSGHLVKSQLSQSESGVGRADCCPRCGRPSGPRA